MNGRLESLGVFDVVVETSGVVADPGRALPTAADGEDPTAGVVARAAEKGSDIRDGPATGGR